MKQAVSLVAALAFTAIAFADQQSDCMVEVPKAADEYCKQCNSYSANVATYSYVESIYNQISADFDAAKGNLNQKDIDYYGGLLKDAKGKLWDSMVSLNEAEASIKASNAFLVLSGLYYDEQKYPECLKACQGSFTASYSAEGELTVAMDYANLAVPLIQEVASFLAK